MGSSRRRKQVPFVALGVLVLAGGACSSGGDPHANTGSLAQALDRSAASADVPRDLLLAIASVEGGLELPARRVVNPSDDIPAAGPLMLRHGKLDTLARGAVLVEQTELALREDGDLALLAGAKVLRELIVDPHADWTSWEGALEEMSGYVDDAHRAEYAHRVYRTLARGGTFRGRGGELLTMAPHAIPPHLTIDLKETLSLESGNAEYPPAAWIPTSCNNKCTTTRDGPIGYVVIHDTEGGWDASVATLQNDAGKSVQYIVGQDGRVAQFVKESIAAWHCGNHWYNHRSVGIEHVGYTTKPYTEKEYAESGKLVSYLVGKYGIKVDRAHIIGHEAVPNGTLISESAPACSQAPKKCESNKDYGGADNHTDPGDWEWATYMPRIGGSAKCNDVLSSLACSWDGTEAFDCTAGHVNVQACSGGCTTQGGTASCAGAPLPPPTLPVDDAGNAGDPGAPPTSTPPTPSPSADGGEPPVAASSADQSSGCSTVPAGSKDAGFGVSAIIGALTIARRRRRI